MGGDPPAHDMKDQAMETRTDDIESRRRVQPPLRGPHGHLFSFHPPAFALGGPRTVCCKIISPEMMDEKVSL